MINVYWYSSGFAILPLCSMFQIQNLLYYTFFYIKEQEETVEWNQITYNGVSKYTGKIFMRLINQWLQVIS